MTVTCQRCGTEVREIISTQFHNGWCIDCIEDLIASEQEAVAIIVEMTRRSYLEGLTRGIEDVDR